MKKVLTTKDIQEILNIGENTAYKLIKQAEKTGEFRVIRVGRNYRVSTESFLEWIDNGEKIGI